MTQPPESNGTLSLEVAPEQAGELATAAGVCLTCAELVQPDQDGCPRDDDHPVRWFKPPEPPVVFPLGSLRAALPHLRRPFTKEAIRFKVQTVFKDAKGCMIVGYIDARLVYERLNLVVGALWHDDYEPLPNDLMLCRLTVDGVTRQNVGSGYKGKGLYSDALKRTAVAFGVGVSVYALPQITLFGDAIEKGHLEKFTGKQGPSLRLTDKGHAALRSGYAKWLAETGIPQFGEPIDHGDVEDSAGEEPEAVAGSEEVSDLPAVAMPLTDDKADALRARCREVYKGVSKAKLPKARFDSELGSASTSHDALEAFAARLEELAK